jgi:hypothetical protein
MFLPVASIRDSLKSKLIEQDGPPFGILLYSYCGHTYGSTKQIVDVNGIALFVFLLVGTPNLSTLAFSALLTERPNQAKAMSRYLRQRFAICQTPSSSFVIGGGLLFL